MDEYHIWLYSQTQVSPGCPRMMKKNDALQISFANTPISDVYDGEIISKFSICGNLIQNYPVHLHHLGPFLLCNQLVLFSVGQRAEQHFYRYLPCPLCQYQHPNSLRVIQLDYTQMNRCDVGPHRRQSANLHTHYQLRT